MPTDSLWAGRSGGKEFISWLGLSPAIRTVGLPLPQAIALNGPVPAPTSLLVPEVRPLVERLGQALCRPLPGLPGKPRQAASAQAGRSEPP